MKDRYSSNRGEEQPRVPEARYSYYRRCQLFRRNGEQCKAPAEKGAYICYAHAGQLATAVRRERERRAVLAEAVAEMHRRGKPECEMADLFTDFKGIQVTLAVTARALINGRIDCKTAGRMVVHLQTCSKLLWQIHRKGRKGLPLINTADNDRKKLPKAPEAPNITGSENPKPLTTKDAKEHEGLPQICQDRRELGNKKEQAGLRLAQMALPYAIARDIHGEDLRVVFETKVRTFPESRAGCRDGRFRDGPGSRRERREVKVAGTLAAATWRMSERLSALPLRRGIQ